MIIIRRVFLVALSNLLARSLNCQKCPAHMKVQVLKKHKFWKNTVPTVEIEHNSCSKIRMWSMVKILDSGCNQIILDAGQFLL
jgi:hypothetical protein